MKATKRRSVLSVLAAVVGVLLYTIEKPYSLCYVREHPKLFAGRLVAIKGTLYGYSGGLIHLGGSECCDAWATVELSEFLETSGETAEMLASIQKLPDQTHFIQAQVIVEGDLEDHKMSCFAPRFVITARRLDLLGPASLVPLSIDLD